MKKDFFDFIKGLDEEAYLEYYITYLISPVFTGVKPSSLIGLDNRNRSLLKHWSAIGHIYLEKYNLKSITLRSCMGKDLILIYNEKNMLDSINQQDNKFFLQKLGYANFHKLEDILCKLYERYNSYHCPHEIGIFLGIPLPDVQAFMNCEEKKCLLCGYWKVFSNEEKARELFRIYDWSKETVISYSLKGKDLTCIINSLRTSLYKNGKYVKRYPIAIGKPSIPTPKGNFKIINKAHNPGRPFGDRWLGLSAPNGDYGIHGTNNPISIEKAVSNEVALLMLKT